MADITVRQGSHALGDDFHGRTSGRHVVGLRACDDEDGTLATPRKWNAAGWYAEGVVPGESGRRSSSATVTRRPPERRCSIGLGELTPGSDVTVTERDGSTNHFVVQVLQQVANADFPTDQVHGGSYLAKSVVPAREGGASRLCSSTR